MSRLLIVSNRLPVTAKLEGAEVSVTSSSGGLATAMRGPHERLDSVWLGWPGDLSSLDEDQRRAIDERLLAMRAVPVHLTQQQVTSYYDGFSNGVLWPLFHYLIDTVQLDAQRDWESYVEVNARFAAEVIERYQVGDRVWIHDYQLALVPQMIREKLPEARIGFFLHIPFPSSEVFRLLPWREQILRGLLGADLVGFHTASFRHNFAFSAARVLGLEPEVDSVTHDGRRVRLGVYPISIDFGAFEGLATDPEVRAEAEKIRAANPGHRLVIGVDRFDYTKGIPRRLLAFERLLQQAKEPIRLIQLAVPTRENVDAYAALRGRVNELVGRINAQFGTVAGVPIHLLHRSVPPKELAAMYLAADVMLVTPLRDGMNLVAKEFVAARVDDQGVLVLSEFAGAADELTDALLVNPYDLDSVASAVERALAMPPRERTSRMRALRGHVRTHDVHAWASSFLADLEPIAPRASLVPPPTGVLEEIARAERLALFLDYDGTLVGFAPTPDLATPDDELRALLRMLIQRRNTDVHIVSGRRRDDLERFFGELPLSLHAEHGFWQRPLGEPWRTVRDVDLSWKKEARAVLDGIGPRTRGAFIEEKTASLAWHYRRVDPELASARLRELRLAFVDLARVKNLELLHGDKVLELRVAGIHKGLAVPASFREGTRVVAFGDDRTDEDLFAALPSGGVAVHVGRGESSARFRVGSPREVRAILTALVS